MFWWKKKGDSDYFTKLNQIVSNKDLQATFYKYLSNIDVSDFISCKIPQTEYLEELKETFEAPLLDFIKCKARLYRRVRSRLSRKL